VSGCPRLGGKLSGGSAGRLGSPGSAAGSWLLVLGADRAKQLVGAALADPGRSRDLAGVQPGAGSALVGDELADPGAAVAPWAAAVAGGAAIGCGRVPWRTCRSATALQTCYERFRR